MAYLNRSIRESLFRWFYVIAEPPVKRMLFLVIYLMFVFTGVAALFGNPVRFITVGGESAVISMGLAFVIGGGIAAVAIMPGSWWLEKAALILIAGGLGIRGVLVIGLGISLVGGLVYIIGGLFVVARFLDISRDDLAPVKQ